MLIDTVYSTVSKLQFLQSLQNSTMVEETLKPVTFSLYSSTTSKTENDGSDKEQKKSKQGKENGNWTSRDRVEQSPPTGNI